MTLYSILCNLLHDVFSTRPLQNTQGWIAWVITALLEHSTGYGTYLSLWKCRKRIVSCVGILLVAGELSVRMQEKYGAVVREDPLWPSSCVLKQLVSMLIFDSRVIFTFIYPFCLIMAVVNYSNPMTPRLTQNKIVIWSSWSWCVKLVQV